MVAQPVRVNARRAAIAAFSDSEDLSVVKMESTHGCGGRRILEGSPAHGKRSTVELLDRLSMGAPDQRIFISTSLSHTMRDF